MYATPKTPVRVRSNAPPPHMIPGSLPSEPLVVPPARMGRAGGPGTQELPPTWARDVNRFSTLFGALTLSAAELRALKKVPRARPASADADGDAADDEGAASPRVTRARSRAAGVAVGRQRISFGFQMGARHVRGKGMPVYALLSASAEELGRHMAHGRETVMEPFGLRKACICIQWPFPRGDDYAHVTVEEWIHVDPTMTRVHLAMNVAKVFNRFYEKHRVSLGVLPEYAWLLRPDAMFRVWLTALEHTENDMFVAEFKYAKDYPAHNAA